MQDVTKTYYRYLIVLQLRNGRTDCFTLTEEEFTKFTSQVDSGEYDADGAELLGIDAYGLQVDTAITQTLIWKI